MALAAVIPTASAGTALTPLHITKECSEFTGETPSFCTITVSDLAAIPVGGQGHVPGDPRSTRTELHREQPCGPSCRTRQPGVWLLPEDRRARTTGRATFWRGTESSSGFHASVDVTYVSGADFDWDGTYVFELTTDAAHARGRGEAPASPCVLDESARYSVEPANRTPRRCQAFVDVMIEPASLSEAPEV